MKRLARRSAAFLLMWATLSGCGSDDDGGSPSRLAVLAAFPAELAALLERTAVDEIVVLEGRAFRVGTLGNARVIVGMTGIGLANATNTTRALLGSVEVRGVVVSGVAGSPRRIGDVTVPAAWSLVGGPTYDADPGWIDLAREIAGKLGNLETCTVPPSMPELGDVCLEHVPDIFVGGVGETSDPFPVTPYTCRQGGDDVFGCDVSEDASSEARLRSSSFFRSPRIAAVFGGVSRGLSPERRFSFAEVGHAVDVVTRRGSDAGGRAAGLGEPAAADMETAAIAREAAARDLPFIAFRAVSDGEGDPLDLPGFPGQFFTYYRLAAHNAAAATEAFLERLADCGLCSRQSG